ncbi:MAG: phosphoglycerate dehydrogenase [Chloroflexi bacterium]|nr:phosphoglycerate dehydrogenase [Chloroflexota bacterium]
MFRILVSDPVAREGLALLNGRAEVDVRPGLNKGDLLRIIGDYDGLIVRSETKVTADVIQAARRLQVIGRAGVGVDNIDLEAATRGGIAVVNAPTGNTVAAAEHTMALILALARHIPQANASLREGRWQRSAYLGIELQNRVLGIVGLGRVGSEVARRAAAFSMRLLAYDPFVAPEYARRMGVELVTLDRLVEQSDFITLHTPLSEATRGLIGDRELARMKAGARVVNVARGGLVDEGALLKALEEGKVGGAALDVFAQEPPGDAPLLRHPRVVATPHLGASTQEAQQEVAREVAQEVLAVLEGRPARSTVNLPFLPPEAHAVVGPYLSTARLLGTVATQLCEGQFVSLTLRYSGELATHDTSLVRAAALVGLLTSIVEERLNLVNVGVVAAQRRLKVVEEKDPSPEPYGSLIALEVQTTTGPTVVSGTLLREEPHILRINDQWLDLVPSSPYLLMIDHEDRPGMIGALGTITGEHDINIAFMAVGRQAPRGKAIMVVGLDDPAPEGVMQRIRAIPHIYSAKLVKLAPVGNGARGQ